MRIAVIKEQECQAPESCNYICAEVCPRVREGLKETVYPKANGKAAINESLCISCGICVNRCPFDAIRVINLPDEMMKEIVFQYGINTFRIYNIATPVNGKILGLIGRNGIGKTTNLNLISNILKPNFGSIESAISDDEIIKRFRGKDIQPFLTSLYRNGLKISKKPQEFELHGKVSDLVKTNRYALVDPELYDRDASTLSGGESQLVELASVLDEDAAVYILDEPMNYLDVTQRIKVAELIRSSLTDKTIVIVEHDLIMLDYMTDFIQILYGSDANYGVVSRIMQTRNGINNYIKGYLPTENVMFRPYEIKIKKSLSEYDSVPAVSWSNFDVEVGDFKLKVNAGRINRGEIIGIIGPNGIGKSTFMRALVGLIDTAAGKMDLGIKISYKPQFLKKVDMLVQDAFASVKPSYTDNQAITDTIHKLGVDKLLNKNVRNLSGGELQKVAIVSTLITDADLYLFDEPSANLDIEDRLESMNAISNFISSTKKCAMIIDHDVMFIDSITSRTMIFTGKKAKLGTAENILHTQAAINAFLKTVDITMRRDIDTGRPRINQPKSRMDVEQKARGEFFQED